MQIWMWLAAGSALIALELITTNLVLASLGVSALAGGVASWLGAGTVSQAVVFAVVAAITLGVIRPVAIRNIRRHSPESATNVERLVQSEGRTVTEVTERSGQAKLGGEVWTARTRTGVIPADTPITVVAIEGAIAIITAKEAQQ